MDGRKGQYPMSMTNPCTALVIIFRTTKILAAINNGCHQI